jgi:hypothetical protein
MAAPKIPNRPMPPRHNGTERASLWDDDEPTRVYVPFFIPDEEHSAPPAVEKRRRPW